MERHEGTNETHGHGRGVDPPPAPCQFPVCRVLGCSCGLADRGAIVALSSTPDGSFAAVGLFSPPSRSVLRRPGSVCPPRTAAGSPPRRAPVRLLYFALLPRSSLLASSSSPRSGVALAAASDVVPSWLPLLRHRFHAMEDHGSMAEVITVVRCIQ